MDLNQLLFHHQIALMAATGKGAEGASLVDHYARKISNYRRDLGLASLVGWPRGQEIAR